MTMTEQSHHGMRTVAMAALALALGSGCPSDDGGDESSTTPGTSLTAAGSDTSTSEVDPTTGTSPTADDTTTTSPPPPPPPTSATETTGPPPPPPAECDATPMGGEIALIDDLEPDDGAAAPDGNIPQNDGRIGFWFTYNDGTAGGMQDPAAPFTPDPGGAEGSAFAARTWGSGFTDWGSGMAVAINNDFEGNCPYDGTAYEGISFWARGTGSIRFHVSIAGTLPPDSGGTCAGTCFDDYGLSVDLTDEWTYHEIAWGDMSQEGWGDAVGFDAGTLMEIHWQSPPSADFDVYVDNVSFFPDEGGGGSGSTGGSSGSTGQ